MIIKRREHELKKAKTYRNRVMEGRRAAYGGMENVCHEYQGKKRQKKMLRKRRKHELKTAQT